MNPNKFQKLQEKYAELESHELDDPEHHAADELLEPHYSGIRTLLDAPYQKNLDNLDIALIGVPFDLGVTRRAGARFGPKAIREEGARVGPINHETKVNPFKLCRIADVGDVDLLVYTLEAGINRIEDYFKKVVAANVVPVSAGGDHSVTYPIMKAIGRREPVGMIHIDAHCDTMGELAGSKFHHGGPFRQAVLAGVLDPERSIQIGIRGAAEPFWEFSYDSGMTVIHIEDVVSMGMDNVILKAREVIGDGPTYITFDVDGLDPVYAPGTGTPEIGGLSTREAIQLLRGLRGGNFVGGDLVEVAPEYDATSNTSHVGKQMMFEILCLVAESLCKR